MLDPVAPAEVASYLCPMAHEAHSSHDHDHGHGHDHDHGHHEPEQNEIGGPVVFALILFGLVITVIGFLAA